MPRIIESNLTRELILPDLHAETKTDVLSEFAETIAGVFKNLDKAEVANVLLEREKLGSTGIQDGIAIPHGKLKALDHILLAFGRSVKGIDYQAHDNQPTQLFFVLLAPENATGMHLKVLARLSRLLKQGSLRENLLNAKDAEEIYKTLLAEDEKV